MSTLGGPSAGSGLGPSSGSGRGSSDGSGRNHLQDAELVAYVHRQLSGAERERFDRHLDNCLECRRRLLDHGDFQRRLQKDLTQQLSLVHPATGWSTIAPQVHQPRSNKFFDRLRMSFFDKLRMSFFDKLRMSFFDRLRMSFFDRLPWASATNVSRRGVYAALTATYVILLLVGGFFLFTLIRNFAQDQQVVSLVDDQPTPTATRTPVLNGVSTVPVPTPTLAPTPEDLVWNGTERVNLLLMGIDQRQNRDGYWRTDTMIILTLDPQARTLGMISVPRDLWVPIWAYDIEDRINTAHYYGDSRDYPGGGPALARDTVSYNLGIPIHHYIRVNFTAFERLIDEIGGIDVYVDKNIADPAYPDENYGFDPFYLSAGQHHLDGEMALKYARTRHGSNDFERARRQQKVILAVRDQVVQLDQLPGLVANGPQILNTLGDSVRTDLTFDQAVELAQIASEIPLESIQGAVIDHSYTMPYTTNTGAQVLIPLRTKIAELYESFFETDE